MKQKGLKVWIAVMTGILTLAICGCDSDDGESNTASISTPSATTPTTPTSTSSSNDAAEIASLSLAAGADGANIIGCYGTLESFSQLPVNFQVTGYNAGGIYVSIPAGEENLEGFPGDHMEARRTINIAVQGNTILKVEDGNGPWCSSLGEYSGQADKVFVVHAKHGQAVSRTKLTNTSEL